MPTTSWPDVEHSAVEKRTLPSKWWDLHTLRASEHFKVKPEDVTPDQRLVGKTLNYYTAWTA